MIHIRSMHKDRSWLQVPFIGWTGDLPLAGLGLYKAVSAMAEPFASFFMSETGRQFFLLDGKDGGTPLLVRKACTGIKKKCKSYKESLGPH
jgi:hypothetical protein